MRKQTEQHCQVNRTQRIAAACIGLLAFISGTWAQTIYVSLQGKDQWPGTQEQPVATLKKAQELARTYRPDTNVEVIIGDGTYYLPETFCFTAQDSKTYPATVTYRAQHPGKAILSGGLKLTLS